MPYDDNCIPKHELVHHIARRAQTSLRDTERVIDAFTAVTTEYLIEGRRVRLMGFGTFSSSEVAERTIKSIKDGSTLCVPAHRRAQFSQGEVLARALAEDEIA